MAVTSTPVISTSLAPAQVTTGVNPIRMLIVGQIGSAGTATSGAANQEVQNMTVSQINGLFGTGSELSNRIFRALLITGGNVSLWVIGLSAAGGGAAATFNLVVSGTATAAGTITVKAIDSLLFTLQIAVANGDTAATVATAIYTAIGLLTGFPATVTNGTPGTVAFTARDVGTLGNKYTILTSNVPAGLTITNNGGQFASGATDPTLTNIFVNVPSTRFHSISWPWQSSYTVLKSFLEGRNVISNAFLQGLGYIGYDDTEANIHTNLNGTTPVNSPVLVFMGNRQVSSVSFIITPPDWRVAEFMAIEALRLTVNAPIAQFITTTSPLDQLGGPALASLPLFNTPLPNTDIEPPDNLFSGVEQANAIIDGFTVIGINSGVTVAITAQVITTYKTNTLENADTSFKYVEYVRTGYTALEFIFNSLKATYAQMRLTQGNPIGGRAMVNVTGIFNFFVSLFGQLGGSSFVLVPTGKTAIEFFKANLVLTPNYATGTINVVGILPIVTQLRTINMPFQLAFTVGGN